MVAVSLCVLKSASLASRSYTISRDSVNVFAAATTVSNATAALLQLLLLARTHTPTLHR
jgi:hypothetical protein